MYGTLASSLWAYGFQTALGLCPDYVSCLSCLHAYLSFINVKQRKQHANHVHKFHDLTYVYDRKKEKR